MRITINTAILTWTLFFFLLLTGNPLQAQPRGKISVLLRIDDYGIDNTAIYESLFRTSGTLGIPLNVGVVPFKCDSSGFPGNRHGLTENQVALLKRGIDSCRVNIALHGYCHRANYLKRNGTSEFYGSPPEVQHASIREGKEYLDSIFDTRVITFIPPWNSYDDITLSVLSGLGFRLISPANYGLTGSGSPSMKYLPYTTDLAHVRAVIEKLAGEAEGNPATIVVLFHTYDFLEDQANSTAGYASQKSPRQRMTLPEYAQLLQWMKQQGVDFYSFGQAATSFPDLSQQRFRRNHLVQPFVPVPAWLLPEFPGYYLATNDFNWYNIKLWGYLLLFYIGFFVASFLVTLLVTGTILQGNKGFAIYFSILIIPALLLMIIAWALISHRFGYKMAVSAVVLAGMFAASRTFLLIRGRKTKRKDEAYRSVNLQKP
jgi:hypothetical protein